MNDLLKQGLLSWGPILLLVTIFVFFMRNIGKQNRYTQERLDSNSSDSRDGHFVENSDSGLKEIQLADLDKRLRKIEKQMGI